MVGKLIYSIKAKYLNPGKNIDNLALNEAD
jgi:hypothetical protein